MSCKKGRLVTNRVFLVGNFLSSHGLTPQVCETLCQQFKLEGFKVFTASNKLFKPLRLLDILFSLWRNRNRYDVALIDNFSGLAFMIASASAKLCTLMGKPYMLILHGGNLPDFFKSSFKGRKQLLKRLISPHPLYKRATAGSYQKIFRNAARIVSPSSYLALLISRFNAKGTALCAFLQIRIGGYLFSSCLKISIVPSSLKPSATKISISP